jgi:hypothetical protein
MTTEPWSGGRFERESATVKGLIYIGLDERYVRSTRGGVASEKEES